MTTLSKDSSTLPPPAWLQDILDQGFVPYIATSKKVFATLNTHPFNVPLKPFLIDNREDHDFMEAYRLSNALSFKTPDLKMEQWVMVDLALLPTAIIGFMKAKNELKPTFVESYKNDPNFRYDALDFIPVSGQIATPVMNTDCLNGFSLFSLRKEIGADDGLGLYTKALALECYKGAGYRNYQGVAQYNNPAIRIHGRLLDKMIIQTAMMTLHPKKEMTFIYGGKMDYDPYKLDQRPEDGTPDFWLDAHDTEAKKEIEKGMEKKADGTPGDTYVILPPFSKKVGDKIMLPIQVLKP